VSVGTISFDTDTFHPAATLAGPTTNAIAYNALVAGDHAVVAVNFASGRSGTPPDKISLVDLSTGDQTELLSPHGRKPSTSDIAVAFQGAVYWDEYPHNSAKREIVHQYTIANGQSRVVYDGPRIRTALYEGGIGLSAAGLWWTGTALNPNRPAALPAPVARNTESEIARQSLHTDGTSFAWRTPSAIGWWAPGKGVVTIRTDNDSILAVAGPLVFYDAGPGPASQMHLLDTRTGTVFAMTSSYSIAAHGGVVVLGSTTTWVIRVDTATLPPLACG
jgi:hypothetical protein